MRRTPCLAAIFLSLLIFSVTLFCPCPEDKAAYASTLSRLPSFYSTIDPFLFNFNTQTLVFDVDVTGEFGATPLAAVLNMSDFSPATDARIAANIDANFDLLVQKGVEWIEFFAVEGGGLLWLNSPTLLNMTHGSFDYNSQYQNNDPDSDLAVDESTARKRYVVAYNAIPLLIQKAHARGIKVAINVESLAHIINKAEGAGIGGSDTSLNIADNLPAPDLAAFGRFIDEVIDLGPDAVTAEAYSDTYDTELESLLKQAGIPYWHTGPGRGDVWVGYYYSQYPSVAGDLLTYQYLHTHDGQLAMTNGDIYARARAQSPPVQTSLVVGAYNPLPCNLSLTEFDLYSETRTAGQNWIDNEVPLRADGAPVQNCAVSLWRNLVLYGVLTQNPDIVQVSADLEPSVGAALDANLLPGMKARVNEHPFRPEPLPVANIILDVPAFDINDGFSNEEYLDLVAITILPLVSDGLEAAGFLTVLTEEQPWTGGEVALTYLITPGGNEDNGDSGIGAPYWSTPQDIPDGLLSLLTPGVNHHPVFVHPVWGIPDTTNWKQVRTLFGMPAKFSYQNSALSSDISGLGKTSLVSSLLVNVDGDNFTDSMNRLLKAPITPAQEIVNGFTVRLPSYLDDLLGQTANIIQAGEVDDTKVIAQGPMVVSFPDANGNITSTEQYKVPYLVGDGNGNFLWTINQLHHEIFTYLLAGNAAESIGMQAPLAAPAAVQMRGGEQVVALSYDQTQLQFNMVAAAGTPVRIRIYDYKGDVVSDEIVSYSGTLTRSLAKRSLLVAEPVQAEKGDLDGNGIVQLQDALIALKVNVNDPDTGDSGKITVRNDQSISSDRKVGLPDVMYILRKLALPGQ